MELIEILSDYPEQSLDQIAKDKLDAIANVRLPKAVLVREISSALSSYSYVAPVMAASQPPTYAFCKLLMESPNNTVAAAGYRESVNARTDEITERVATGTGLPTGKDYKLYRTLLKRAWSSEGRVNESEADLLEALRFELGISMREHLLLEHHPEVRETWESPRAYSHARNYLLARGLVLSVGDRFVLPKQVVLQIRRYWEMSLTDDDFGRLLAHLTVSQLRAVLEQASLPTSGTKEDRISRVILGLVSPEECLSLLSNSEIRDLNKDVGLRTSMPKAELISQLIEHFDDPDRPSPETSGTATPGTGSDRSADHMELLAGLSSAQLYDILATLGLRRTGSKAERLARLYDSHFETPYLLSQLRRMELSELCRQFDLPVSGLKDELVERLVTTKIVDRDSAIDEEVVLQLPTPTEDLDEQDDDSLSRVPVDLSGASSVEGLHEIALAYPNLRSDQQTMLASLKVARSLNERDVRRLAARHGLGWFLPEAHMAELIRDVSHQGGQPVQIRSTGAANIYEWNGDPVDTGTGVNKLAARDVIEALRQGVVPNRHQESLLVGQDAQLRQLDEQLEYIASGRSSFKFIRGAYGSGKSMLLAWLKDRALKAGFAISSIRVSAEQNLADLAVFYRGLMDGLRISEKQSASSLGDILESWLLAIQRDTERREGLSAANAHERDRLLAHVRSRIDDELGQLAAHSPGLASALVSLYEARVSGDDGAALAALAWIRGDSSLSAASLRQVNVRGQLEPEQAIPRLRAVLEIISSTHLSGLVVLVDELELVRRRPNKQTRDRAYETLRALIDEVGENRLHGCLIVCTGTDEFFDDPRNGLASYEALANRIVTPSRTEHLSNGRQPVMRLTGLGSQTLREVARKTRELHALAYEWPASERVSDDDLDWLVYEWTQFGGDQINRLPRPFLRQLVHILDLCEENPSISARESFTEPSLDQGATDALLALVGT